MNDKHKDTENKLAVARGEGVRCKMGKGGQKAETFSCKSWGCDI